VRTKPRARYSEMTAFARSMISCSAPELEFDYHTTRTSDGRQARQAGRLRGQERDDGGKSSILAAQQRLYPGRATASCAKTIGDTDRDTCDGLRGWRIEQLELHGRGRGCSTLGGDVGAVPPRMAGVERAKGMVADREGRESNKLEANVRTRARAMAGLQVRSMRVILSRPLAMASLANPVVQRLFEGLQASNRRLYVLLRSACSGP
jgi:hypothetical protein